MTAKASAPSSVRKQPEIFCLTLGMRIARSAKLLVKGTAKLSMKRRTSDARWRSRRSRLQATDCLVRPRLRMEGMTSGLSASPSWRMVL